MWDRCEVFSATKYRDRDVLGEKVTAWLEDHPQLSVVDTVIRQSSDSEFHCLTIVLFLKNGKKARRRRG